MSKAETSLFQSESEYTPPLNGTLEVVEMEHFFFKTTIISSVSDLDRKGSGLHCYLLTICWQALLRAIGKPRRLVYGGCKIKERQSLSFLPGLKHEAVLGSCPGNEGCLASCLVFFFFHQISFLDLSRFCSLHPSGKC